ncbi:MAG TPA: hypothetical protein VEZ70_08990 [Allosphingosinicella sp.]|nr:hypothetical protein [Allosphingosinicella sp.]
MRLEFDLEKLRDEVAPTFRLYDDAVRIGDSDRAYDAKCAITRKALDGLMAILPYPDAQGLYLFAGHSDRLAELRYIGKASPGSLFGRLEARLRDETCLDTGQYGRAREDVWDDAYRRICVSMGRRRLRRSTVTAPEKMLEYAFQHVKTTLLFDRAARVILIVSDAGPEVIKGAESLLIYSAVSAGAPLINMQERSNLTTSFDAGIELALSVIREAGIDAAHWTERATSLLGRFHGRCC